MDTQEYIIISKTAIQKRIEKLETQNLGLTFELRNELKQILSQSTLLIPEIEKAFDEGKSVGIISYQAKGHTLDMELYNERKQDYTSNLKLDT